MVSFEISVSDNQEIFPIKSENIEKEAALILEYVFKNEKILAESVLNGHNLVNATVSVDIVLTDDEEIRELNASYRAQDKPTDVLSFALFADSVEPRSLPGGEIPLGEVIISVETAKKQADENKIGLGEETRFLLCHGILHLLGFTHPDEESLEVLLQIQNEVLLAIKNLSEK